MFKYFRYPNYSGAKNVLIFLSFFLVTSPVNYFIISSFNSWAEGTIRLGVYITDRLCIICTDWESLNQLKRNFSAKSWKVWSQRKLRAKSDRTWKSTKKTVKTTSKVRPNYEQGGQKKMKKPKYLFKGGSLWKITYTGVIKNLCFICM